MDHNKPSLIRENVPIYGIVAGCDILVRNYLLKGIKVSYISLISLGYEHLPHSSPLGISLAPPGSGISPGIWGTRIPE